MSLSTPLNYLTLYRDFSLQRLQPYHTSDPLAAPEGYQQLLCQAQVLKDRLATARFNLPVATQRERSESEIHALSELIDKAGKALLELEQAQRRHKGQTAPAGPRLIWNRDATTPTPVPAATKDEPTAAMPLGARLLFGSAGPKSLTVAAQDWALCYWRVSDFIDRRQKLSHFALARAAQSGRDPFATNFNPLWRLLYLQYEIPAIAAIYGGGMASLSAFYYLLSS